MRGRYRREATAQEWCDRALLARIHRQSSSALDLIRDMLDRRLAEGELQGFA